MNPVSPDRPIAPTRRTVLLAAGAAAVATTAAACSTDSADEPAGRTPTSGTPAPDGAVVTPVADVPVGGGVIVGDLVVTQARDGDIAAFSTRCPHMGCAVSKIEGGHIDCACHGSEFNLDGSVAQGPATTGLSPVKVSVRGTDVVRG